MIRGDEPWAWTKRPVSVADSGGGRGRRPGDLVPDREAVGHHRSLVGRRQQVPTGPKVRPDAAQRGQQPLRVPDRREAFHRPLALPGRLVRVLGAVVQVRRPAMGHRRHQLAARHRVAGQLVGDDHPGHLPQALAQSAEQLLCGHRVSARPDQDVGHVAVLVDRAPQVPLCTVDLGEHLIEAGSMDFGMRDPLMRCGARTTSAACRRARHSATGCTRRNPDPICGPSAPRRSCASSAAASRIRRA